MVEVNHWKENYVRLHITIWSKLCCSNFWNYCQMSSENAIFVLDTVQTFARVDIVCKFLVILQSLWSKCNTMLWVKPKCIKVINKWYSVRCPTTNHMFDDANIFPLLIPGFPLEDLPFEGMEPGSNPQTTTSLEGGILFSAMDTWQWKRVLFHRKESPAHTVSWGQLRGSPLEPKATQSHQSLVQMAGINKVSPPMCSTQSCGWMRNTCFLSVMDLFGFFPIWISLYPGFCNNIEYFTWCCGLVQAIRWTPTQLLPHSQVGHRRREEEQEQESWWVKMKTGRSFTLFCLGTDRLLLETFPIKHQ